MSKKARRYSIACALLCSMLFVTQAAAQPQPQPVQLKFPVSSNNVLFVDANGAIVYGVANLHVTDFLGVPVVGGTMWVKSTNQFYAFAAVQTANRKKWVWLTNGGPAGTATATAAKVGWADNQNQRGCIVPL